MDRREFAEAKKLRSWGLSYREIEAELGIPRSTVNEWLNPTVREARLHRGDALCPLCGGRMKRLSTRCIGCRSADAENRALEIEEWWAEGLKMAEIAQRLGISVGCLAGELDTNRERGYNLPYRHKGNRMGAKFPSLR